MFFQNLKKNGSPNILADRVFSVKCCCHVIGNFLLAKIIFNQNLIYHKPVERKCHIKQLLVKTVSIKITVDKKFSTAETVVKFQLGLP